MSDLVTLAAKLGAPLVRQILERKIGSANTTLVTTTLEAIAGRVGVPVDGLEEAVASRPEVVAGAIMDAEAQLPPLIDVLLADAQGAAALASAEGNSEHFLAWAWRPAAMWGFGALWFWALVIVPTLQAITNTVLVAPDLSILLQLNVVYMGLYMGGHTVKDFVATRWGVVK